MTYRIVIEFPDEHVATRFCGQMSDGFGENYCDFSFWRQKPQTAGNSPDDFERVKDERGLEVYFVKELFI